MLMTCMRCQGARIRLLLGLCCLFFVVACSKDIRSEVITGKFIDDSGAVLLDLNLEVVATPAARAKGLMFRNSLRENQGMLFVFPKETPHSFWMKNTQIPLDMVFISKEMKVVEVIENATPFSEEPRGGSAPSLYVIEIQGGLARARGIGMNSSVILEREITTIQ